MDYEKQLVRERLFFARDQAERLLERLHDALKQLDRGDFTPAEYEMDLASDRAQRAVQAIASAKPALNLARAAIARTRGGK